MYIFIYIMVGCWAAFILFWIVSAFGVKRDIKRSIWWRLAWLRIVVVAIIVSVLWKRSSFGVLAERWTLFQAAPVNLPLATAGALLCVFGTAYAIWARVHLGRNWSPAPTLKEGHELVTSGPYQLVRHPIYTGVIAAALGTACVIPLWFILFFIILGMFVWRIKVEEGLMMKQFPNQYPEYKKHTWALVPWVW